MQCEFPLHRLLLGYLANAINTSDGNTPRSLRQVGHDPLHKLVSSNEVSVAASHVLSGRVWECWMSCFADFLNSPWHSICRGEAWRRCFINVVVRQCIRKDGLIVVPVLGQ